MHDDDDPRDGLARIIADGRRKQRRRLLTNTLGIGPAVVVAIGTTMFLGIWIGLLVGFLVGLSTTKFAKKLFPPID